MTKLVYVGPAPGGGILPLPEGWPPFDHEEADAGVAAAKIRSGYYRTPEAQEEPADAPARRRAAKEKED